MRRWLERLDEIREQLETEALCECPNCKGDKDDGCDQCNAVYHIAQGLKHIIGVYRTYHHNPSDPKAHGADTPTA